MYNGEQKSAYTAPQPQYPHQRASPSKTPAYASIPTPFSDVSSSSSTTITEQSNKNGGPSQRVPGGHVAWVQEKAERARAQHIARVSATTGRTNPYANASTSEAFRSLSVRALTPSTVYTRAHTQSAWFEQLRAGIVAVDRMVRRQHASELVGAGRWDRQDGTSMAVLVAMFVECAVEGDGRSLLPVAPFAKEVYEVFRCMGEGPASAFEQALGCAVWSEFEAWWDPSKPTALASLAYKGSQKAALSPALAIISFMADLWSQSTLPGSLVGSSLQLLVCKMVSIEHLRALRVLLSRLDIRFQKANPQAMQETMQAIYSNFSRVHTSYLGEPFCLRLLWFQWEEINNSVARWELPASQQSKPTYPDWKMMDNGQVKMPSTQATSPPAPQAIVWQPARPF